MVIQLGLSTLTTAAQRGTSMSILLCGVGPACARLATNDFTHGLRHQAARRARRSTTVKSVNCLPRSRMLPTACRTTAHPSRKFHPCLSPEASGRCAARKLLFVHGVRFAGLLGIGGRSGGGKGSCLGRLLILNTPKSKHSVSRLLTLSYPTMRLNWLYSVSSNLAK